MKTALLSFGVLLCSSMVSTMSFAQTADDFYFQAQDQFAQRSDLSKNDQAIENALAAFNNAEDDEMRYDALILASRAYYWKGLHVKDSDKKDVFGKAMDSAAKAKAIYDEFAEGYYYYAIALGRWAEANGILESLFRKDELIKTATDAKSRITRDLAPGETIDGYGPDRTLGRVYFKLPGFAGGSHALSVSALGNAYAKAPTLALNVVYYAETLASGSADEKNIARKILDQLLSQSPETINPNRVPESREEFVQAAELRKSLGN